eukprot:TRINITY_DN21744_c0_g1_i2.p1 TRINITY_DN21744_c0_g1~~TRINITY_DN21744_c0_g1_i2.p1  ORF type:complete len:106 (-),score=15.72 TRINITY_DN21744_c0_g1_i2:37-354(-)
MSSNMTHPFFMILLAQDDELPLPSQQVAGQVFVTRTPGRSRLVTRTLQKSPFFYPSLCQTVQQSKMVALKLLYFCRVWTRNCVQEFLNCTDFESRQVISEQYLVN